MNSLSKRSPWTNERGFSLIDVVVTVAIIVALSVGGFVAYTGLIDNAKAAAVAAAADQVFTAAAVAESDGNSATNNASVKDSYEASTEAIKIAITGSGSSLVVVATDANTPSIRAIRGADANTPPVVEPGPVTVARTNLFPNPNAVSLNGLTVNGFTANAGQTRVVPVTDGGARFNIDTSQAVGISVSVSAIRGTESRLLMRARANRPLDVAVRQRSSNGPVQTMSTDWQWYEFTTNPGAGTILQSGFLLTSGAGHMGGDWIEIDRVHFATTPDSGPHFSGESPDTVIDGVTYDFEWTGTPNNSTSVATYRPSTGG